jgi:two-component system sensor histidine kinase DctS
MLTEAFRILIKNAIEAIDSHRQSSRELWLESRLRSAQWVEITVRDSGLGIKPENLNHIFEMGWSTKKGTGMGFGLFWTRDYIEGFGGTIDVESTWQSGTTFTVCLPTSANHEDATT